MMIRYGISGPQRRIRNLVFGRSIRICFGTIPEELQYCNYNSFLSRLGYTVVVRLIDFFP